MHSLIYLIETYYDKQPKEESLGGRLVSVNRSKSQKKDFIGIFNEHLSIPHLSHHFLDGHFNRNIRMMYSMAESIVPWIEVLAFEQVDDNN